MWHRLTSGIWADGVWWTLDKEAIWAAGGQGTLISEPTKKVANRLLGFPSVHIVEWKVSLFAQTSLEIVPLMINGMRAKKVSSETVVDSTCSLFNWLFCQVGAHAKPVVSAWHGYRQQVSFSFFQLHGNVVTSPFYGDWEGAEALAACLLCRTLHFFHHILCMTSWYRGQVLYAFTPELAGLCLL